jgi:hypothetical protein
MSYFNVCFTEQLTEFWAILYYQYSQNRYHALKKCSLVRDLLYIHDNIQEFVMLT